MLKGQLFDALRPMVGFTKEEFAVAVDESGLGDNFYSNDADISVSDCHDLLQTTTLIAASPKNLTSTGNYLQKALDNAVNDLITTLAARLAEAGLAASLLSPTTLFTGVVFGGAIIPAKGIVGLRFMTLKADVTLKLNRLLYTGQMPEGFILTLTCEQTGQTSTIVVKQSGSWQDLKISLQANRTYTLTYDSTLAGVSAMNTFTAWPSVKKGCAGCAMGCLSNYVSISALDGSDCNYGLNLVFSAEGDVSGRLVDNPSRLIPLLKKQVALSLLNKIANSREKNPATEDARDAALYWLTDKDNKSLVPVEYERLISSLVKSLGIEASPAIDVDQKDEVAWGTI